MTKLHAIAKRVQLISQAAMLVGAILMILHWSYGRDIVFFSGALFYCTIIICLLTAKPKSYGHWAGIAATLLFGLFYLRIESLDPYNNYIIVIFSICGLLWYWDVGMEDGLISSRLPFNISGNSTTTSIWVGSTILIVLGALFKIMHWEYANVLLFTGMLLAAGNVIYTFFPKKEN